MFAGVGERTREGNDLYREMIESGVIKLGEKQVSALYYSGCFTMFHGAFFFTFLIGCYIFVSTASE